MSFGDEDAADAGARDGSVDAGLSCLALILGFHQIPADPGQLRHALGHGAPAEEAELVRLAKRLGAKARVAAMAVKDIERLPLPAIAQTAGGGFFILGAIRDGEVLVLTCPPLVPRS